MFLFLVSTRCRCIILFRFFGLCRSKTTQTFWIWYENHIWDINVHWNDSGCVLSTRNRRGKGIKPQLEANHIMAFVRSRNSNDRYMYAILILFHLYLLFAMFFLFCCVLSFAMWLGWKVSLQLLARFPLKSTLKKIKKDFSSFIFFTVGFGINLRLQKTICRYKKTFSCLFMCLDIPSNF